MTHDELRDYIDKFDAAGMVNESAIKALRAVVELHSPSPIPWDKENILVCDGCGEIDYPCPTIRAIEKELL